MEEAIHPGIRRSKNYEVCIHGGSSDNQRNWLLFVTEALVGAPGKRQSGYGVQEAGGGNSDRKSQGGTIRFVVKAEQKKDVGEIVETGGDQGDDEKRTRVGVAWLPRTLADPH